MNDPTIDARIRLVLEAMRDHGLSRLPYRGDVPCIEDVALVKAGLRALNDTPPPAPAPVDRCSLCGSVAVVAWCRVPPGAGPWMNYCEKHDPIVKEAP